MLLIDLKIDGRKSSQLFGAMRALAKSAITDDALQVKAQGLLSPNVSRLLKVFTAFSLHEQKIFADELVTSELSISIVSRLELHH